MSSTATLPDQGVRTGATSRANSARYLYLGASVLFLVLVFLGFRPFYMHGGAARGGEVSGPVKTLLIVHGIAMTGWVILFFVQPLLILNNRRSTHRSLGMLGAVLAASIVMLGPWTAIRMAQVMPDVVRSGVHMKPFLAFQFGSILNFGTLVALGVWARRRPEIHRPMMLLATLAVMGAAANRITWLRDLFALTIWSRMFGPYFIPLVIGVIFLAVKTALTRSFDRWLAIGLAALTVSDLTITAIAHNGAWTRFANGVF